MPQRTIEVDGVGERTVSPDRVSVTVSASGTGETSAAAYHVAADRASSLRDALVEAGVSESDLRTEEFTVKHRDERFGSGDDGPPYRAVERIAATCDPAGVEAVVSAATEAGASVSDVTAEPAEETQSAVREEVLKAAVRDARRTAETIAAAEGETVGRLVSASHSQSSGLSGVLNDPLEEAASHDIEPGPIQFSATVSATYELEERAARPGRSASGARDEASAAPEPTVTFFVDSAHAAGMARRWRGGPDAAHSSSPSSSVSSTATCSSNIASPASVSR